MNGWMGTSLKVKPDQMQIMNPIMILLFLPVFQYGVYPLIEKCGIKMTPLRRMGAGQALLHKYFGLPYYRNISMINYIIYELYY